MKLTEEGFFQFARRYFVKDGFDALLTMLGVMMGAFVSGITEPRVIIFVGITTCVAMGVSGVWGTFLTESAERRKKIHELEKAMLTNLDKSIHSKSHQKHSFLLGLIDGLPPFATALIVLTPFAASELGFIALSQAYQLSFLFIAVALFLLGAFLGKISKKNLLKSGAVMLLAGVVTGAINLLLGAI